MVSLLHKTLGEGGGRGKNMSIKNTDSPKLCIPQEEKGQKKRTEGSFPIDVCICIPLQIDLGILWDTGAY